MKNYFKTILTTFLLSSMFLAPRELGAQDKNLNKEIHQNVGVVTSVKDGNFGKASYYHNEHGKKMANGKIFNKNALTCAHNKYPFGTKLKVTNPKNGKSVIVTVTDRGGFNKLGRIIDLSEGAFKQIASLKSGVIKVKIEKL